MAWAACPIWKEGNRLSRRLKSFFHPSYRGILPTLLERTSRPSPRILDCCFSSWILLDTLLWAGWGRVEAELDRNDRGSAQARRRERARDNRSDFWGPNRRQKEKTKRVWWRWSASKSTTGLIRSRGGKATDRHLESLLLVHGCLQGGGVAHGVPGQDHPTQGG